MSAPKSNGQARSTSRDPHQAGPDEGPDSDPSAQGSDPLRSGIEDAFAALGDGLESHRPGERCVGWCPVCRTADLVRAAATPELRESWSELQHELLLTVRAIADRYLERERADARGPTEVQEIPID